MNTVTSVVLRNGESAQAVHDEWEMVYIEEHKKEAMILAKYYTSTGYFSELVRDISSGVIPDMRAYMKMSGNKYAQKVLEPHHSKPKYDSGTLVTSRANCLASCINTERDIPWLAQHEAVKAFKTKGGFVLQATDIIRSTAKGAKTYKILPIGSAIPVFIEERHIKLKRK